MKMLKSCFYVLTIALILFSTQTHALTPEEAQVKINEFVAKIKDSITKIENSIKGLNEKLASLATINNKNKETQAANKNKYEEARKKIEELKKTLAGLKDQLEKQKQDDAKQSNLQETPRKQNPQEEEPTRAKENWQKLRTNKQEAMRKIRKEEYKQPDSNQEPPAPGNMTPRRNPSEKMSPSSDMQIVSMELPKIISKEEALKILGDSPNQTFKDLRTKVHPDAWMRLDDSAKQAIFRNNPELVKGYNISDPNVGEMLFKRITDAKDALENQNQSKDELLAIEDIK